MDFRGLFGVLRGVFQRKPGAVSRRRKNDFVSRLSNTTLFRLAAFDDLGETDLDPAFVDCLPEGVLDKRSLLDAVRLDFDRDTSRLLRLISALSEDERPPVAAKIMLGENFSIEASARPGRTAGAPATLVIDIGLILMIEDLLLSALTKPDFFNAPELFDETDDSRTLMLVPALSADWQGKPAVRGFDWLQDLKADHPIALLNAMPYAPWRLVQYEMLREFCIQWILLHEFVHWAMGHLGALTSINQGVDARLSLSDGVLGLSRAEVTTALQLIAEAILQQDGSGPKPIEGSDVSRSFEFSADRWALHYLFRLHEHDRTNADSIFARHLRAMTAIHLPPEFTSPAFLGESRRSRYYTTAAAIVALALSSRERHGGARDEHYPTALSRLINLLNAAIVASPFVDITEEGVVLDASFADDPSFQIYLKDAWLQPQIDFMFLNRILDIGSFIKVDPETLKPDFSPVIDDILRLFDPTAEASSFLTDDGRDYFSRKEFTETVENFCSRFALVTKLRL